MKTRRTKILRLTLLIAGFTLCGASVCLLLMPAQYRATAKIAVKTLDYSNPDVRDEYMLNHHCGWFDGYWLPATFEFIKSNRILTNVLEVLNLNQIWGKHYTADSRSNTAQLIELLKQRIEVLPARKMMTDTPVQRWWHLGGITHLELPQGVAEMFRLAKTIARRRRRLNLLFPFRRNCAEMRGK